jgi:hypothetical protein
MATVANEVKATKNDAFHMIFNTIPGDCNGMCTYEWDSAAKEYVLVSGSSCTGGSDCHACATTKSSSIRELIILERSFADPDAISHPCGVTYEHSFERLLDVYLKHRKRHQHLVRLCSGLGLLWVCLLAAFVYLLLR